MNKIFTYILIFFLLGANSAIAAEIVLTNSSTNVKVGDEVLIEIIFDTQEKFYNAIEGDFMVPNDLEIRRIIAGNSIISAWIENPNKTKNNHIRFSGIIAGGYKGDGLIFSMVVVPKISSTSLLETKNISVFLNDGHGTEEILKDKNISFYSREIQPGELNSKIIVKDSNPPTPFRVSLIRDKNIADGKYVLIFGAQDKESGIRTYQVLEGKKLFKQAESPYVLENQRINERIYVKAIDYENNERVSKVTIPGKVCIDIYCVKQYIIIIIIALAFIPSFIIWRRQTKELKRISEEL